MAIGTAAAIVGSAAIGAIASSKAGKAGQKAAENAAELQAQAQREATDLQREIFETTRADQAPYRAVGVPALSRLAASYGLRANPRTVEMVKQGDEWIPADQYKPPAATKSTQPVGAPVPVAAPGQPALSQRDQMIQQFISAGIPLSMADQIDPSVWFGAVYPTDRVNLLRNSGYEGPIGTISNSPMLMQNISQPAAPVATTAPAPERRTETVTDYVDDSGMDALEASQRDVSRIAEGFKASPGYQFRLDEGQSALLNASRARGMALSGGALKESQRYGEGLAADEFDTFMRRGLAAFGDYRSGLAGLAGVGQAANNASQVAGQNFASTAGQLMTQGGQNQANALLAGGAIKAGGISNIGNILANAGSNYMLAQALRPQTQTPPPVTGTSPALNYWPG